MSAVPEKPKIYHVVHVDRLPSIIADGWLWCEAEVSRRSLPGTNIGMNRIKQRRLETALRSHPALRVGDCVPFYFCPRSVMLYLLYKGNHPDLTYRGGQGPIVHLEADLHATVDWADSNGRRWAYSLSNAGSFFFEDRADLARLYELDWNAIGATDWRACQEGKQAEWLMEHSFPWSLVERVGVCSRAVYGQVLGAREAADHKPVVEVIPDWYY